MAGKRSRRAPQVRIQKRSPGEGGERPGPASRADRRQAARARPRQTRSSWIAIVGIIAGIAAVVAIFFIIRWTSTPPAPPSGHANAQELVASLASIPPSNLDRVGRGSVQASFRAVNGPALTGPTAKPEVFYLGGEYCPYCAAERWPLIIALSRFGTLTGVEVTTSAANDVYPNTPTFTFRHATYQSQYIDFVAVEEFGNQPVSGSGYNRLQTPTPEQAALVQKYDAPPYTSNSGSIPFIDFGNRRTISGASYQPDVINGMSWQQVVNALQDPNTSQARAILGTANLMTVAICEMTGDQPASVCADPAIKSLEQAGG